jgi:hypothetical protein
MHRGSVRIIASRRHQATRKAFICLGALALISGAVAQASPASATPLPGSTSNCTYSNATTPANSAAVLGVTPGSTITISCAAGSLQASSLIVLVEASGLAGIVSPSSDQIGDVDLNSLGIASTAADGSLSTTFTVPAAFSASDTNAACPPTQAQINAGLTCDLVLISVSAGLQPVDEAMLLYQGQGTPDRPTLRASVSVAHGLKTVSVSDVPGACPTPPTADSHCWWGAATTGAPNAGFSGIPAPETLLGGHITSGTLHVSPAVYCQTDATAPACASVPVGTLIPPALSGTITTRHGIGPFLTIEEPNATPYPGNGSLPNLIPLTRNVSATVFEPFIRH